MAYPNENGEKDLEGLEKTCIALLPYPIHLTKQYV